MVHTVVVPTPSRSDDQQNSAMITYIFSVVPRLKETFFGSDDVKKIVKRAIFAHPKVIKSPH